MPARQITAPSVTKASQISFLQELTLNNLQESTVAEMLDCVLSGKYDAILPLLHPFRCCSFEQLAN